MSFDPQAMNKDKSSLYASVFNTPQGTKVLEDLMSFVGYMGDAFKPNDPYATAYNLGQRRVVQRILNLTNYLSTNKPERLSPEETFLNE
jgi:hypothetical protein